MPRGIYKRTDWHKSRCNFQKGHTINVGRKISIETKRKMSEVHKRIGSRPPSNLGVPCSEETKRKISISRLGDKNWMKRPEVKIKISGSRSNLWQGGKALFHKLIKVSGEYITWRKKVFKRDNYTCQDCGKWGGRLHPHHIKPFAKILRDFLHEYNQFSLVDDKETLVRLSFTYKPFWEVSNGKTLCKDCHKQTPTYGKRGI